MLDPAPSPVLQSQSPLSKCNVRTAVQTTHWPKNNQQHQVVSHCRTVAYLCLSSVQNHCLTAETDSVSTLFSERSQQRQSAFDRADPLLLVLHYQRQLLGTQNISGVHNSVRTFRCWKRLFNECRTMSTFDALLQPRTCIRAVADPVCIWYLDPDDWRRGVSRCSGQFCCSVSRRCRDRILRQTAGAGCKLLLVLSQTCGRGKRACAQIL
jgi:hypothetical protein